jgi:hypothetical protein
MSPHSDQLPEDLSEWRVKRYDSGIMILVSRHGGTRTAPVSDTIPQELIAMARRIQAFALAVDPVTNRRRT